jgi:hypothetical protein
VILSLLATYQPETRGELRMTCMKTEWVATWCWPHVGCYLVDAFATRTMALDWVGDRKLISLVEVEVPCNDGSISK